MSNDVEPLQQLKPVEFLNKFAKAEHAHVMDKERLERVEQNNFLTSRAKWTFRIYNLV